MYYAVECDRADNTPDRVTDDITLTADQLNRTWETEQLVYLGFQGAFCNNQVTMPYEILNVLAKHLTRSTTVV